MEAGGFWFLFLLDCWGCCSFFYYFSYVYSVRKHLREIGNQNPPASKSYTPRPSARPPKKVEGYTYHAEYVRIPQRGMDKAKIEAVVSRQRRFEWNAKEGTWNIIDNVKKLKVAINNDGMVVSVWAL